jgi:hypothetical protein
MNRKARLHSSSSGSNRLAVPLAVFATLSITSCMHAKIVESREFATSIGRDEAVVLLAKPHVEGTGTEEGFTDCVASDLSRGEHSKNGFRVDDNHKFVDALFPWFEPSTAPTRPEGLTALFNRPLVAAKLAETGVRYVVWFDGETRKTDGGGSIACGAGPGGAGCIGFGWWEKESDYVATVWDLKETRAAGTVSTNVTGTSALVGVIVPLPFIARVQGTACDRMADQLRSFLRGDDLAASSAP